MQIRLSVKETIGPDPDDERLCLVSIIFVTALPAAGLRKRQTVKKKSMTDRLKKPPRLMITLELLISMVFVYPEDLHSPVICIGNI